MPFACEYKRPQNENNFNFHLKCGKEHDKFPIKQQTSTTTTTSTKNIETSPFAILIKAIDFKNLSFDLNYTHSVEQHIRLPVKTTFRDNNNNQTDSSKKNTLLF